MISNDVSLVAISGLGGHAFGSFKSRGGEHMWLCDDLPLDLPGVRVLIYGHDSKLENSTSFQGLEALSSALMRSLRGIRRQQVGL